MKIHLKEPEIIQALKDYLQSQGIRTRDKQVTMFFTAGRGKTGLSTDIDIEDLPAESKPLTTVILPKSAVTQFIAESSDEPASEAVSEAVSEKAASIFG